MNAERVEELVLAAVIELEDGKSPFSDSFLTKHSVSYDECMALSDMLALGGRLYILNMRNRLTGSSLVKSMETQHLAEAMMLGDYEKKA